MTDYSTQNMQLLGVEKNMFRFYCRSIVFYPIEVTIHNGD